MGAYSVVFTPGADLALAKLPLTMRGQIRQRLNEIALVADSLSFGGGRPGSTQVFELAGYMISYVILDASRTVNVLSIVPV